MSASRTFREMEGDEGIQATDQTEGSALGVWYRSVRDKPLSLFSDKDLGIACRQRLYTKYVVPVMIDRLEMEPLAGDMYDGELLISLAGLPREFWARNAACACVMKDLLGSINAATDDADVLAAVKQLEFVIA